MSSTPGARRSGSTALVVVVVITIVAVALAVVTGVGARIVESLYPPLAVTTQGAEIRNLYTIVFIIAVVIFFLVEGLIVWTVIRYRRQPGDDTLPPQIHGNNIAEITWTVIPTLVVAFLFIISWQTLNSVDATTTTPDTKIRAVAGQFQWEFDYMPADYDPDVTAKKDIPPLFTQFAPVGPDGGLDVPTGRTVQLYLTSPDVIHAFYVPQFLFKRDVVPGRVNRFDFNVDPVNDGQTFRGQCAELCGTGHRLMLFEVHALSATDFDAWLAKKVADANATPAPSAPASPGASGAPSGPPVAGTELKVSASGIAFEQTTLSAPANSPITIDFENKDAGTPHDIKIFKDAIGGTVVFDGKIFPGVATEQYQVGPLAAGTYPFECFVHPNMTGTLTVQ
jgi:cytochrome c oxidase subunit II